MAQAHSEQGEFVGGVDHLAGDLEILVVVRGARSWPDDHVVEFAVSQSAEDPFTLDLLSADHHWLDPADFGQQVCQVEGEGIVVVDQQDHGPSSVTSAAVQEQ